MDPVSLQAANLGVVRPAIALQGDLSAVLREGRVLAGEVLQTLGGGSFLIGIGRHRVPAESQVELREGHRFLFVVEGEGEALVLRVLGDQGEGEPALLRALRGVLGQDRPLGELLRQLAGALGAEPSSATLLADLAGRLAGPELAARDLAALFVRGGLAYEARLSSAAALALPPAEAAALAADLEAWLVRGLAGPNPTASPLVGLGEALAALLGAGSGPAEREAAFAAWLAGGRAESWSGPGSRFDLEGVLAATIERLHEGSARAELLARLRVVGLASLGRGLEVLLLRRLLGLGPAPAETVADELGRAVRSGASDLKGLLLGTLAGLPEDAPQREALARTLAGLEAEQLLNVARREAGEPTHWSLPVADGERWATAHVLVERRRSGPDRGGAADGSQTWRLALSLELSNTGPLHAELLARPEALSVRVRVAREEVARTLERNMAELETRLAHGGRRVHLTVATVPAEALRVETELADVRYLREHRLMDLSA